MTALINLSYARRVRVAVERLIRAVISNVEIGDLPDGRRERWASDVAWRVASIWKDARTKGIDAIPRIKRTLKHKVT
jgi:hypothetical protein